MKVILLIIVTVIFHSCNFNKKTNDKNLTTENDIQKNQIVIDSLDIDTSDNYITSNFPKNVNDTLYRTLNSLWAFVINAYELNSNSDSIFNFRSLNSNLLKNGYFADTISNLELKYHFSSFNKRQYLEISDISKVDFKCALQDVFWANQKKYTLRIEFLLKVKKANDEKLFDFKQFY